MLNGKVWKELAQYFTEWNKLCYASRADGTFGLLEILLLGWSLSLYIVVLSRTK
jgi:hypothetical protein